MRGRTEERGKFEKGKGKGKGKGIAGRMSRRDRKDDVLAGPRFRRKVCRFCEEKVETLDYKDTRRFERLVSERGKILSRRITGVCARHQRKVEDAVKKARFMALLPFLKR